MWNQDRAHIILTIRFSTAEIEKIRSEMTMVKRIASTFEYFKNNSSAQNGDEK